MKKLTAYKFLIFTILFVPLTFFFLQKNSPAKKKKPKQYPNPWFLAERSFPESRFNHAEWIRAERKAFDIKSRMQTSPGEWRLLGPENVGGRITDIQGSALRPKQVFAGTASGGVFRTDDGGDTWIPTFSEGMSLSIGALAIDVSNPDNIWVGTGEANSSGTTYPGSGIYFSNDAGNTWEKRGLEFSRHIGRIVLDPNNSNSIYVAVLGDLYTPNTERGVYHTEDGGKTWQQLHFVSESAGAIDIVIDPTNTNNLFAAFWDRKHLPEKLISGGKDSSIYRTQDRGKTWSKITKGIPASPTLGRIGLSLCANNPNIIYSIFDDSSKNFVGVYKSSDSGENWNRIDSGMSGIFATFGWWFGNVRVSPVDCNQVYALGLYTSRSTNGGNSWSSISNVHADNHALYINPAIPSLVYLGNDGGAYRSVDGGKSFKHLGRLPVTQFYAVGFNTKSRGHVAGGAQDNGTVQTKDGGTANWKSFNGGDGFQVIIDPVDPNIIYSESQNGVLSRSTNGGASSSGISPGATRANWNTPILLDPNNHTTLYYGGNKLYRSTSKGSNWQTISPDLSLAPGKTHHESRDALVLKTITAIAVAPSDSQVIYAGTDNGRLWVSKDSGKQWHFISQSLPLRWVTGIAVDPIDASHVFVSISGYRSGSPLPHLFESNDYGSSWNAKVSGLPEIPINVVRFHKTDTKTLFIGTDYGVYVTNDLGNTWKNLGTGFPSVPVTDLAFDYAHNRLLAATFGRSMWELDFFEDF